MQIDFYVTVIDNYGDYGFAFNLAISMLGENKNLKIRFFGDDENLFYSLKGNYVYFGLKYINLNKVNYFEPSKIIYNFFDKKIDFEFLNKFLFEKTLYNFGYLSLDKSIINLHNTNYKIGTTKIIHISPSLLENTGGIIINKNINNLKINKNQILEKYNLNKDIIYKKWISIFVYDGTLKSIINQISINEDCIFFIFDNKHYINSKNIVNMPFLSLQDYYSFLNLCDINLVRGENSFIQAFISKKPFLWDIYKEHNLAHKYKIFDFRDYIITNYGIENKKYLDIFNDFNLENKADNFKKFLNLNYEKLFFNKQKNIINILDNI